MAPIHHHFEKMGWPESRIVVRFWIVSFSCAVLGLLLTLEGSLMQLYQRALFGKKVLVVGLGRSGVAAARLCAARGAQVTVTDKQPAEALTAALAQIPPAARQELGGIGPRPSWPLTSSCCRPACHPCPRWRPRASEAPPSPASWSWRRGLWTRPGRHHGDQRQVDHYDSVWCNSRRNGRPTFVGGNLGVPFAEAVGTPAAESGGACVLEVSSFQLETVVSFRPQVAVLLNISPDHLDRHPTLDAYVAIKARIFAAQTPADFAWSTSMIRWSKPRPRGFAASACRSRPGARW